MDMKKLLSIVDGQAKSTTTASASGDMKKFMSIVSGAKTTQEKTVIKESAINSYVNQVKEDIKEQKQIIDEEVAAKARRVANKLKEKYGLKKKEQKQGYEKQKNKVRENNQLVEKFEYSSGTKLGDEELRKIAKDQGWEVDKNIEFVDPDSPSGLKASFKHTPHAMLLDPDWVQPHGGLDLRDPEAIRRSLDAQMKTQDWQSKSDFDKAGLQALRAQQIIDAEKYQSIIRNPSLKRAPAKKDPAVLARQQELIKAGAKIKADGIMGPQTQKAEKEFGAKVPKAVMASQTNDPGAKHKSGMQQLMPKISQAKELLAKMPDSPGKAKAGEHIAAAEENINAGNSFKALYHIAQFSRYAGTTEGRVIESINIEAMKHYLSRLDERVTIGPDGQIQGGFKPSRPADPAAAPADAPVQEPKKSSVERYTPGVTYPAAYTISYNGKEYKFAGREKTGPGTGEKIVVGAGAVGIRGLAPTNVELGNDGMYYIAGK